MFLAALALASALLASGNAGQAPQTVTATTHQVGLGDTTSNPGTGTTSSPYGPIWASDNDTRIVTATPDAAGNNTWDVTVETYGTYNATGNPMTGDAWNGHGALWGEVQYVVKAAPGVTPNAHNVQAVSPNTYRSHDIMDELFGLTPSNSSQLTETGTGHDGQYTFMYFGIPGAPNGIYVQHS
jgi:hypothetical protein